MAGYVVVMILICLSDNEVTQRRRHEDDLLCQAAIEDMRLKLQSRDNARAKEEAQVSLGRFRQALRAGDTDFTAPLTEMSALDQIETDHPLRAIVGTGRVHKGCVGLTGIRRKHSSRLAPPRFGGIWQNIAGVGQCPCRSMRSTRLYIRPAAACVRQRQWPTSEPPDLAGPNSARQARLSELLCHNGRASAYKPTRSMSGRRQSCWWAPENRPVVFCSGRTKPPTLNGRSIGSIASLRSSKVDESRGSHHERCGI